MPIQVRDLKSEAEFDAYLQAAAYAFHTTRDDALLGRYRQVYKPEWCMGAFDGSMLVAGLTIVPFEQHMMGASISFGGIATVASLPEHRRGGHVSALLRAALVRMHERGQALSGLYTPHFSLYRKFGWEIAYRVLSYSFAPKSVALRRPRPRGSYERITAAGWERLSSIRQEATRGANGPLSRDEGRWRSQVFSDNLRADRDVVVWSDAAGQARGYAAYGQRRGPGSGADPETVVRVADWVALDGEAYAALLAYLLSHDLASRIVMMASEDEPIASQFVEPALLQDTQRAYFGMALRLVDVQKAFAERPAPVGCGGIEVVIGVEDAEAPWNSGVWRISSGGLRLVAERSSDNPAIEVDAAVLGPLYNGFISPAGAARAGLLSHSDDGALERLQRLLAVTSRPFCIDDF